MRICVVAIRRAWKDENGCWQAGGGLPFEVSSLHPFFDQMILVLTEGYEDGGMLLPADAQVITLRQPVGHNARRKLDVFTRFPYYVGSIFRAVRQSDVIYLPVPGDMPLIGMALALILRKRIISCFKGSWADNSQTTRLNRLTKFVMRRLAGGRNVFFALGWGEKPPAPRMNWLFGTALSQDDLHRFQSNLDRPLSDPVRLAYVGRLSVEKGLPGLFRALAILKHERGIPDGRLHLTLIGDGPQRPELEQLAARSGLQSWVSFLGQVDHDAVLERLLDQDVMVFPSLSEGFGKARLDALMCGLPLITTEVGYGREFTGTDGERGWIIPVADDRALAQAIETAITQPRDWPAMRRRCREFVEGMTLEAWADRITSQAMRQWRARLDGGKIRL